MSKRSEVFGQIAEAFENLGTAFRKLESADEIDASKSAAVSGDGVAGAAAKPGGKKAAAAEPVAAKPAGKGKTKPAAAPAITYEALKAKVAELLNAKGREVAMTIISGFGAKKLVDIDPDDFEEVNAQVVAALAEEDAPAADEEDDPFGD